MDDNEDAQLAEYRLVSKLFPNKIAAFKVSNKGKYISQKLECILSREKVSGVKSGLDIKEQEMKLEQLQEEIMLLPNIEALNNLESNLEMLINRISIRMVEEMSFSTPASIISVRAAAAPTKSTHLKFSLPQFSGQILDW